MAHLLPRKDGMIRQLALTMFLSSIILAYLGGDAWDDPGETCSKNK